jgi:hypothetical protein
MNTTTVQKQLFYYHRGLTIPVVRLLSIYNNIFPIFVTFFYIYLVYIYHVRMIKGYILFLYSDMECYIKKAIAIRIKGI